jgi:hypothetical protein
MSHFVDSSASSGLSRELLNSDEVAIPRRSRRSARISARQNDKVLVERIGVDLDLHLLAAAGDYGEHRRLRPERRDCCAGNNTTKPIGQAGFLGRSILVGFISVSIRLLKRILLLDLACLELSLRRAAALDNRMLATGGVAPYCVFQ